MLQNATECLKKDLTNIYAKYLVWSAPNQSNKYSKIEQRVQIFQKCISLNNNYIEAHIQMGIVKYQAGDNSVVRHIFTNLLTKDRRLFGNQWSQCYKYLGLAYLNQNDQHSAIFVFKKAQNRSPFKWYIYTLLIIETLHHTRGYYPIIVKGREAIIKIKAKVAQKETNKILIQKLKSILFEIYYYIVSTFFRPGNIYQIVQFFHQQEQYLLQYLKVLKEQQIPEEELSRRFQQQINFLKKYGKVILMIQQKLYQPEPNNLKEQQLRKYRSKMIEQLQVSVIKQCTTIDNQVYISNLMKKK